MDYNKLTPAYNPIKNTSTKFWFIVSISITFILLCLLVWNLYFSYNTVNSFKNRELAIERNSWKLMLHAETMKMAARMSAASGNLKWQETYEDTKPKLDKVLQEIPTLVPTDKIRRKTDQIKTYLNDISKIETKAYDLVSRGKKEEAVALLAGWEYTKNQNKFTKRTQELVSIIQNRISNKTAFQRTQTLIFILVVLASLAILVFSWAITIRLWREQIKKRREAEEKISQLLNNSGQGFMLVDENLQVDPNYSRECTKIFQTNVASERIQDLFFPEDGFKKEHFARTISNLMQEEDEFKLETIISLLPERFFINNKHLQVEYKILPGKQMMLIITDITEKIHLEQRIEDERKRLSFIVNAVQDKNEFLSTVSEYEDFINNGFEQILSSGESTGEKLNELFRRIHTFKGSLNQYEMPGSPELLHQIEEEISGIINNNKDIEPMQIREMLHKKDLQAALDRDKDILQEYLGSSFLTETKEIGVPVDSVVNMQQQLENLIHNLSPEQQNIRANLQELLAKTKQMRFVNVKTLLTKYCKYLQQLSLRMEKPIHPVKISGADLYVDPDKYQAFTQSLIHVFRNSLAHGIEDPDSRLEKDKDEQGFIYCHLEENNHGFSLKIGDDGRGIDKNAIWEKALKSGNYTQEELSGFTEQEFLLLIFSANLSTKNNADQLSGMGVGLNAVLTEARKLNADIKINSKDNLGTEFVFRFPPDDQLIFNPNP